MQKTEYILIADGGSTKVEWCLINPIGNIITTFKTDGINAAHISGTDAETYFQGISANINPEYTISLIHYYGAGCATTEICTSIKSAIESAWKSATVHVESDMLAACRALLGKDTGIACILGTGSNSALFDGESIIANIAPLGYILGDEGSGTALGKRLIGDVFKGIAPKEIITDFAKETGLTKDDVIRKTYRSPSPNKFLASFVPFIKERLDHPYMLEITKETFLCFFKRNIIPYHSAAEVPVNFIGSIAANFSGILEEIGNDLGIKIGNIVASPIPGLIKYHTDENKYAL